MSARPTRCRCRRPDRGSISAAASSAANATPRAPAMRLCSPETGGLPPRSAPNWSWPGIASRGVEALRRELRRLLGRSLRLRQISAGGCNGCEVEVNALGNVVFDSSRFGIEFVASPRHADGVLVTGPITANMREATLRDL